MKLFDKNLDDEVVVIAEIGNNHEGNLSLAKDMISRAAEAGVDAVKFQTFQPEHFVSRFDTERFEQLKRFQFSPDEFAGLRDFAIKSGTHFFSTPFDLISADLLCDLCDVVKISSGDNTFFPLIDRIAGFAKPIIMSTGLAGISDIARAKAQIDAVWSENQAGNPGLVILHCVSMYPVSPADANLSAIATLRRNFGGVIGYSDHTLGADAAVLSVGVGAQVIEKHFTLDKNHSDFRDHQLSADPAEMAELVERVHAAKLLMGDGDKRPKPSEASGASASRRSIVAARDLTSGDYLCIDDITWVRPGGNIAPGREALVLGRRLVQDVAAGTPLSDDHFA